MATDDTDIEGELTAQQSDGATEGSASEPATSIGGLSENVAGALAYLFAPLLAIVFYLIEEDNEYVRFHSVQSIIVFGGLFCFYIAMFVFGMVLEAVPLLGLLFTLAMGLFALLMVPIVFVLWVVLTYKAYKGDTDGLPITGNMAEKYV